MPGGIPKAFKCMHHRCTGCDKGTSASGGLLFRCQICCVAYCEECVPKEGVDRVGRCERFEEMGFRDKAGCYINCCGGCRRIAMTKEFGWSLSGTGPRPKTPAPIDVSFAFSNDNALESANQSSSQKSISSIIRRVSPVHSGAEETRSSKSHKKGGGGGAGAPSPAAAGGGPPRGASRPRGGAANAAPTKAPAAEPFIITGEMRKLMDHIKVGGRPN